MDIENIWQQQDKGKDDMLNDLLKNTPGGLTSKGPLTKLKSNLLKGMILNVLITITYLVVLFTVSIWQVNLSLVIVTGFNVWVLITSWKLYKNIPDTISSSLSLKQELENNHHRFRQWWSVQQRVSLFVYPVAATGGFMLGGVVGSGKSVDVFLAKPGVLMALAITIVVLVPASHYLSRWMFNHAYGKYLKQMKTWIEQLQ